MIVIGRRGQGAVHLPAARIEHRGAVATGRPPGLELIEMFHEGLTIL
ncbi:hypothetical protein X011_23210 [Mycobacterium tuberculosis variant microti OV254]|nr:hypothetical protein X011_23210 [Mycobacterium tuberculosis variant microti OV254]